mmetsp:Transcript_16207/g.32442  ORF Transcript_16207/g.32442 Transcript_16207/m.32442 type:complete len:245 (+) Transcript_16207:3047-3781(+)
MPLKCGCGRSIRSDRSGCSASQSTTRLKWFASVRIDNTPVEASCTCSPSPPTPGSCNALPHSVKSCCSSSSHEGPPSDKNAHSSMAFFDSSLLTARAETYSTVRASFGSVFISRGTWNTPSTPSKFCAVFTASWSNVAKNESCGRYRTCRPFANALSSSINLLLNEECPARTKYCAAPAPASGWPLPLCDCDRMLEPSLTRWSRTVPCINFKGRPDSSCDSIPFFSESTSLFGAPCTKTTATSK